MNPRWRMLLWEQGRTAGVLCVVIGGIGLLLMLGVYHQIATFRLHAFDIGYAQGSVIVGMLLVAVFSLIVRQDVHAHLVLDFEPRLLRLPVHAAPVALIIFGMRVFFLFMLGMTLYAVHFFMYHEFPLIAFLVLTLNLFLWVQAFSWARNTITGLSYTVPIVIVILCAFLVPAGFGIGVLVGTVVNIFQFLTQPASLLYSIPAALGLVWASIAWRSRDEQHGLPSATDIYRWLSDIGAVRAPRLCHVLRCTTLVRATAHRAAAASVDFGVYRRICPSIRGIPGYFSARLAAVVVCASCRSVYSGAGGRCACAASPGPLYGVASPNNHIRIRGVNADTTAHRFPGISLGQYPFRNTDAVSRK